MEIKKIVTGILGVTLSFNSYALLDPVRYENLDKRNSVIYYEKNNIAKINASQGYVSTLIFPRNETVLNMIVGVDDIWSIQIIDNKLFLKPIPAVDTTSGTEDVNRLVVVPNPEDWKTNLFVITDKNLYQFELNYTENLEELDLEVTISNEKPKKPLTKEEEALAQKKKAKEVQAKKLAEAERTAKKQVTKAPIPKNWNYKYKVGKNSQDW